MGEFLHDHPITPRTKDEKQAVINRLKRIEGQVRGIQKMVEADRYCLDILVQINAINAALNKVGFSVAERHAKHCVSHAMNSGEGKPAIDELLDVIKQFSKLEGGCNRYEQKHQKGGDTGMTSTGCSNRGEKDQKKMERVDEQGNR